MNNHITNTVVRRGFAIVQMLFPATHVCACTSQEQAEQIWANMHLRMPKHCIRERECVTKAGAKQLFKRSFSTG